MGMHRYGRLSSEIVDGSHGVLSSRHIKVDDGIEVSYCLDDFTECSESGSVCHRTAHTRAHILRSSSSTEASRGGGVIGMVCPHSKLCS